MKTKTARTITLLGLGGLALGLAFSAANITPKEVDAADTTTSTTSSSAANSALPGLTPGNFVFIYMNATTTAWYNNAAYDYYFTFKDSTNSHVVRSAPAATTYPGAANLPLFVVQTPTATGVTTWYSAQGEVYLKGQNPNIVDPIVYTTVLTNTTYNLFDCVATSPFADYEDSEDATQHAKYLAGVPLTQRAWTNSWPNKPYASIFADNFLRQTETACSASNAQTLLDSAWSGFASDYAALNATAKGFVKNATAITTPDTTTYDNLLKSCAGRYDYIMTKYASDTTINDFMDRSATKAQATVSAQPANETNSILFVTASLAIVAVGGFFLLRKGKRA